MKLSLNCREIEIILDELDLKSSELQSIKAVDYNSFSILFYKPGNPIKVLVDLGRNIRLHRDTLNKSYLKESHNLVEYMRSHLTGGQVSECCQIDNNRIIKLVINTDKKYIVFIRLWGGFPNLIITDEELRILHLHKKSSKKNELPGKIYKLPDENRHNKEYFLKEYDTETYNEFIEKFYYEMIKQDEENSKASKLEILKAKKEKALHAELKSLLKKQESYNKGDTYKLYGELLISNMHNIKPGSKMTTLSDYNGLKINIPLDERLSPYDNSQIYFKRYKKSLSGISIVKKRILDVKKEIESIKELSDSDITDADNKKIEKKTSVGLHYTSKGWDILVGRNARENDNLLRHSVKGNDMWFHVRDYPGGYVFIKNKKSKTIPLEILKDAAVLALYYSKGKNNGKGDIYYTQVKHLKRIKKGKLGQVIPTMNKNLFVTLDKERLDRLKA